MAMKRAFFAAALLFAASSFAPAQSSTGMTPITAASVWQVTPAFLAAAHKACDNAPKPPSFAECFIGQMKVAGAPPTAVAFTLKLFENGGDVGIMTGFNKVGPVDVAFVTYPLRANTNNGILFVNGSPKIVNAEDLTLLNQADMKQSPQYQNTLAQFPKTSIWPGDRDGTTWPNANTNSEGGKSFTLGYPMLNGCHACEKVGTAEFNWKFGPTGKFLGTVFMGMTPPPVQ
ncbi:MAG TPA: hypothetical protein VE779_14275 [Candidatus Angelobacter sp.]|nr:hypothetical protein [Candidatus Angelobacter sp.]